MNPLMLDVWLWTWKGHIRLDYTGHMLGDPLDSARGGLCYRRSIHTKLLDACILALADQPANPEVWLVLARHANLLGYTDYAQDFAWIGTQTLIATIEVDHESL